jgi:excisionase family DNA binding protein
LIALKSEHQQRSRNMQTSVQNLPKSLTLEEAADDLRLSPDIVLQEAIAGKIPGQPIGAHWRFLKSAIDEWLYRRASRTILRQQAGVFANNSLIPLKSPTQENPS